MKKYSSFILFLSFVLFCAIGNSEPAKSPLASRCFELASINTILQTPLEMHLVMELKSTNFQSPVVKESPEFQLFKKWVFGFSSGKQEDLLNYQLNNLKNTPVDRLNRKWIHNSKQRHLLLLSKKIGRIEVSTCLERYLFEFQLRHFPQMKYPSEFMAFLLQSKSEPRKFRIYFSIGDGKTFNVSPPSNTKVWNSVIQDIYSDWTFYAHIHSHPFMVNYSLAPHIGGTVLPSDEDVGAYQQMNRLYGMHEAWITNGFDTIRLNKVDINNLVKTLPSQPKP